MSASRSSLQDLAADVAARLGWLPARQVALRPQTLYFVIHNRNHVNLVRDAASALQQQGTRVVFATIADDADQPQAAAALEALGATHTDIATMEREASSTDVICLGNDWGPKRLAKTLDRLRQRKIRLIGIIEGARFSFPKQYTRVDEILCWGPSGARLLPKPVRIVGSPVIEKAHASARPQKPVPRALINYKFAYGAEDPGFAWGHSAIAAAMRVNPQFDISIHPASRGVPASITASPLPFHELLKTATLLVTRSSTVIYEALAAGVSVAYFPLRGEKPAEFAEPMGAFQTAASESELIALAARHADVPAFDENRSREFLYWHVSIDPAKSAAKRLTEELQQILMTCSGATRIA